MIMTTIFHSDKEKVAYIAGVVDALKLISDHSYALLYPHTQAESHFILPAERNAKIQECSDLARDIKKKLVDSILP